MAEDYGLGGVGSIGCGSYTEKNKGSSPLLLSPSSTAPLQSRGYRSADSDELRRLVTTPADSSTLSTETLGGHHDDERGKSHLKNISGALKGTPASQGAGDDGDAGNDKALSWFNEKLKSLDGTEIQKSKDKHGTPIVAGDGSTKTADTQSTGSAAQSGQAQKKNSLDSLVEMFKDPSLPGKTARERLEHVLKETSSGDRVHFKKKFDDSGFDKDFQDGRLLKNPELSNNQVGHFLTAVDLGSTRGPLYNIYQRAAIGHEKTGDNNGGYLYDVNKTQAWQTDRADVKDFESAVESAKSGNRAAVKDSVGKILKDLPYTHKPWPSRHPRRGNSHQDLALTAYGYALAQKISDGSLASHQDVAQWLEKNLK
ncbi:MAG: hypothetical protein RDV48_00570 [Candidatus Eremiobacteraeota bacterium]|nr:hypothetical protein [Candidatus Eremiobacteraeota bacterium]